MFNDPLYPLFPVHTALETTDIRPKPTMVSTTAVEGTPKEAWTKAGGDATVSFVPDGSTQVLGHSRYALFPRATIVLFFPNSHCYPAARTPIAPHLHPHHTPLVPPPNRHSPCR